MATIYDLKPKFQALLRPIVTTLADKGITPNQVTYAALILSIGMGLLIYLTQGALWTLLLVPIFMFIRMAMNAIDGILAKEFDMKTKAGAILNELSDVVSDAVLYLPLAIVIGVNPLWVILFVMMGIFTEVAGILAQTISGVRAYHGPMGKSDRAFVFGLICLLLGFGLAPLWWVDALLITSSLLAGLTIYKRAKSALI